MVVDNRRVHDNLPPMRAPGLPSLACRRHQATVYSSDNFLPDFILVILNLRSKNHSQFLRP